jgi:PPM family protein phosphatase
MSTSYHHVRVLASNRPIPEDAADVFERDQTVVVVLADGAGGLRGGAAASSAVVAAVKFAVDDRAFDLEDVRPWVELFRATDLALAANKAGQSTAIVVVLSPRGLIGVSTGDSEACIVGASHVDNLTVGQQTKRRLGSGRVVPASFERPALSGLLLVATDGLFKFASTDVIARMIRANALGSAAEQLVELVRLKSGKLADDIAIVLVDVRPPTALS